MSVLSPSTLSYHCGVDFVVQLSLTIGQLVALHYIALDPAVYLANRTAEMGTYFKIVVRCGRCIESRYSPWLGMTEMLSSALFLLLGNCISRVQLLYGAEAIEVPYTVCQV